MEFKIKSQIAANKGKLPFDEYMHLCLYDETAGYYTSERLKIGPEGDFYTSSNIGTILGEMLASYAINHVWNEPGEDMDDTLPLEVIEWGGGTGRLAKQFLDALAEHAPAIYTRLHFTSIEHNAEHRRLQKEHCAEHLEQMRWLSEEEWFSERSLVTDERPLFVFSNELLDAFPVKRAVYKAGAWREIFVQYNKEEGFVELEHTPTPQLQAYLDRVSYEGKPGEQIEVNLRGSAWYHRVASVLTRGSVLLSIDYGDLRERLWGAHRPKGTLMCYYRHQGHDNPYIHLGEQDITAHVNFSDMIEAGLEAGMEISRLLTQKEFLLEAGVLELLSQHTQTDPFHPVARKNRAIRQLLLHDGMSDTFKVLIQQK